MSAQDRRAEREVADQYVRPPAKPRPARAAKRFAEAFLSGIAVGDVVRKILR